MLDRAPDRRPQRAAPSAERRRAGNRERQRRCRERHKAGEKRYAIVAPEAGLIEALLRAGRVTEAEALDHARVEQAVGTLIAEWAARWLKGA